MAQRPGSTAPRVHRSNSRESAHPAYWTTLAVQIRGLAAPEDSLVSSFHGEELVNRSNSSAHGIWRAIQLPLDLSPTGEVRPHLLPPRLIGSSRSQAAE